MERDEARQTSSGGRRLPSTDPCRRRRCDLRSQKKGRHQHDGQSSTVKTADAPSVLNSSEKTSCISAEVQDDKCRREKKQVSSVLPTPPPPNLVRTLSRLSRNCICRRWRIRVDRSNPRRDIGRRRRNGAARRRAGEVVRRGDVLDPVHDGPTYS